MGLLGIDLIITMKGKKQSKARKGKENDEIGKLLKISKEYQELLQKLASSNYQSPHQSTQAYFNDTLQNLKQLQMCMKQELKQYDQSCSPVLEEFLSKKQLGNASNLIGKYESMSDEIEVYQESIAALLNSNSEEKIYNELDEEEKRLQAEVSKLANRRIQLRNKNEMIQYQIECGEADLNDMKVKLFEEEIKLRKIENGRTCKK